MLRIRGGGRAEREGREGGQRGMEGEGWREGLLSSVLGVGREGWMLKGVSHPNEGNFRRGFVVSWDSRESMCRPAD